ncbi:hypothetical protein CRE_11210 [Caenorhabditis remanei]|uniref:T20D4.11-like domain-containing protein n=1 Tax=Caenorhabditis remanei TaxID=31234 RepID=E3MQD5_CAERE|nr:hypothetical protein CRE_11210 [Caenorhabditis remanei]
MFKLVLICLIPHLVNSYVHRSDDRFPICLSETNNACQEEMKKKNETLERIYHIHHPLTDLFNIYTDQCRKVMECASGLECFKGKSQSEIIETSCDDVGTIQYSIDDCLSTILKKIYSNDHNCTAGFSFVSERDVPLFSIYSSFQENLFTADTIFKKEKQCILNIGQGVCKTDDFNFLQNNYDELIELYTNSPTSDIDQWNHPSEKFYRMHCGVLHNDFVQKSENISILSVNQENADVQKVVEIAQTAQKCHQKPVIIPGLEKYLKMVSENIQAFPAVMINIFERRPRLLEYRCLSSVSWWGVFREVVECMNGGDAKKCVLSFIRSRCQEEILADFEDLAVTLTPRNESNVPGVSFSLFKNNQRRKFVFTVNNTLINF